MSADPPDTPEERFRALCRCAAEAHVNGEKALEDECEHHLAALLDAEQRPGRHRLLSRGHDLRGD